MVLAAVFMLLVAYASLYPFVSWRWPVSLRWQDMVRLPLPPWRDHFDMAANLVGYLPLGFLLYVGRLRSGGRWPSAAVLAVLLPSGLSYALEVTQHFLPRRYPSALDWLLNSGGAVLGMALGALAQSLSLINRWQAARDRWFIRHSAGALALLLLWPVGLLFPAPLPLGLGLGWERVQAVLVDWLLDVPWAQTWLEWVSDVPVPDGSLPPLLEGLGLLLGLLAPCLLAFSITRAGWRRAVLALLAALIGVASTTLSVTLNFGPSHALAWLTPLVLPALGLGLLLAWSLVWVPQRLAAALGMVVLSALVMLVAQAPADPYFAQSLQAWEQGRFIRFHGLAQWLGWFWPYAAWLWLATRVAAPDSRVARF